MKNALLVGVSAAAMVLGWSGRAEAQASNNACGPLSASTDQNTVGCISDPQKYLNGIVYNQTDQGLPPAGLLVDIFATAVDQPTVNKTGVQAIGATDKVAEVNVRGATGLPGGTITATGTGAGIVVTSSGTGGTSRVSNSGTITGGDDGIRTVGGAGAVLNLTSVSSTTNSAVAGAPGLVVTNARGATLTGGSSGTFGYAVQFAGNSGTFNNYGSATGGAGGVTANTNLGTGTGGITLNLYAGSNTGAINLGSADDTVNLYTGATTTVADTAIDPVSGAAVTVRAAGTYTAATTGSISLGSGNNTVGLNGDGTGTAAGTLTLTGSGINNINKTGAGTWTLTGVANATAPTGGAATSAATIKAGDGGANTDGTLIFAGSGLTGAIYVDGALIRSTTASGFGSGTIYAVDPTIQFGATTTSTNNIVLQSNNVVTDPTTLQADNGVTVTLNGSITQGTAGTNNINNQPIAANQPLVFALTPGAPAGAVATFILGNTTATPNNWTGATTVNAGVTLRGTTATISGSSIADAGTVNFNQATTGSNAASISGGGTLLIDGGGSVTLTGAITTTQGVKVGAGTTLTLSNASGATGDEVTFTGGGARLNVASGGTITATGGNGLFSSQVNNTVNVATGGSITGTTAKTGVFFNATSGTDTIVNNGTISGFNAIDSYTTLMLTNSGTLTGLTGSAVFNDFAATGSVVTNTGSISGISAGQSISAAVFIGAGTINNNAGTISGDRGVQIQNGGTVNNSAQITGFTGTNGAAVRLNSGGTVTNVATGVLTATAAGARGYLDRRCRNARQPRCNQRGHRHLFDLGRDGRRQFGYDHLGDQWRPGCRHVRQSDQHRHDHRRHDGGTRGGGGVVRSPIPAC